MNDSLKKDIRELMEKKKDSKSQERTTSPRST
jgi:hypothetical protein